MTFYRIDKTRWRIGKLTVEAGAHSFRQWKRWGLAATVSFGGYEGDELVLHGTIGPFYAYCKRTTGYVPSPSSFGFSVDMTIAYLYWGEDDYVNNQGGVRHWFWRNALLDFLFGKTQYYRHRIDVTPAPVDIELPEGCYKAEVTRERECWMRPRWPFRKVRSCMDIDIPGGIPFAGKGENPWDCDDDALYGTSCDGHDFERAKQAVVESAMAERHKYGNPSPSSISHHLQPNRRSE